jgi:hypothetical protein
MNRNTKCSVQICNPSTLEARAGRLWVQGQPGLLINKTLYFNKKKEQDDPLCLSVITCTYSEYNFVLKFRGFFLGQQGQTQDYSKAWEEYYKKQGIVFTKMRFFWTSNCGYSNKVLLFSQRSSSSCSYWGPTRWSARLQCSLGWVL